MRNILLLIFTLTMLMSGLPANAADSDDFSNSDYVYSKLGSDGCKAGVRRKGSVSSYPVRQPSIYNIGFVIESTPQTRVTIIFKTYFISESSEYEGEDSFVTTIGDTRDITISRAHTEAQMGYGSIKNTATPTATVERVYCNKIQE